ncbi:lipopolysaccharide biosynthesis protein [Cellulomonas cellasea]|uniref:O-antigen/teichoic acid export membrane protein n=1 Tax=Cellulomonas cellasea TaxID=43670 RepID=A0A7W4UHB4_9CELL|nr:oligosaccharide flippase family protein [Cellulomonas cellasea]MBB2924163.1 O-antigen/teichoic acid export membrane protein [Cellulomonas cellasea]
MPSTPPRGLLAEGAVYALALAAPVLATILLTPLVTRSLGAVEYGHVASGIAVYQIAAIVLALGLPAAITRDALIEASGTRGSSGTVVVGTVAAVSLGVTAALTVDAWSGVLAVDVAAARPALLNAAALATLTMCQAQLRALSRASTFVALGVTSALAPPAIGLVLVHTTTPTAGTYLSGLAVGQALVAAVALAVVVRADRPSTSVTALRRSLRTGLPTVPHQLATGAIAAALVLVAARTTGPVAAGQMQLALLLGTAPLVIVGAVNNAWAPRVFRLPAAERAPYISSSTPLVAMLAVVLGTGVAVVAPLLLAVVAPPELATPGAAQAVAVVAAAAGLSVLYLASIHLVFASGRTGWLAVSTPAALAVSLAAAWALRAALPDAGLWTLAAAVPVFHAAQALLAVLLRRRVAAERPRLAPALPAAVGGALACLVLAATMPSAPARGVLVAVLLAGAATVVARRRRSPAGGAA